MSRAQQLRHRGDPRGMVKSVTELMMMTLQTPTDRLSAMSEAQRAGFRRVATEMVVEVVANHPAQN